MRRLSSTLLFFSVLVLPLLAGDGTTPLELAKKGDQHEIAALLEAAGAKR